jgi:hypothetical protein
MVNLSATVLRRVCLELRLFTAVANKGLLSVTAGEFVLDMFSNSVNWIYICITNYSEVFEADEKMAW